MKIFKIYNILSFLPFIRPSLLQKKTLCKDCKYFIGTMVGKECSRFGTTDLVTGKESYEYAASVRRDENKCGEGAKYFEKNHFKFITVPYYLLVDFWPVLIILVFSITLTAAATQIQTKS